MFLDPIQKRAPARSMQLEAVYLEAVYLEALLYFHLRIIDLTASGWANSTCSQGMGNGAIVL